MVLENMSKKRKTSGLKKDPVPEDQIIQFTVEKIDENSDGSVNCIVEMNDYTKGKLIELGVISILKQHISEQYATKPWYKRLFKRMI